MPKFKELINLPPEPEGGAEEQLAALRDYLVKIIQELQYLLSHLEPDNINDDVFQQIYRKIPQPYGGLPLMDGAASSGGSGNWARGDHRHPSDSSKADALALAAVADDLEDTDAALAAHVTNTGNPHEVTKAQVGLGNVADERQYSALYPPPLPTPADIGAATAQDLSDHVGDTANPHSVTAAQVGARPDTWMPTAADVGAQPTINVSGILKGDGAGGVSAATAGTDYGTYSKPSGGIPSSDMASGVQTSLGKADTAYQKPSGGIPASDLASGVIPTVPSPSSTNPLEDGTVSPGSSSDYARGDHVHPHDSIKANQAEFADIETGSTASRAYGIGEYFTQKTSGRLLRVIEPISAGGTFTPGANCEYTTVGSELQDKPKNMVFTLTAGKTLTITKTASSVYSYLIGGAGPAAFGSLWWVMGYSNTGTQTKLVTLSTATSLTITNGATSITIQNTHPSNGARVTVLVLGYEGTLPTYTVS